MYTNIGGQCNLSHMLDCKPAIRLIVPDPELSSQQDQETAKRVPDPFPLVWA